MWICSAIVAWSALAGCLAVGDHPWWKTANLYQVYPRSFKDSLGTGVGNLRGVTKKAQYFRDIGATAVWLSPIFKSPMADLGYDISDYKTVDPIFGTNEDLRELINTFKNLGIKFLLDLVPNHTSDEHEWFQKSVKREDPYTDYYVWVDGKTDPETGNIIPPNNWVSNFSGSAWEWNDQRKQFYLHQFMVKQPDLNYRNPYVVKEMDEIIVYWLDRGVDGFRIDAVPFLFEDKDLRDNPVNDGVVGDFYTQNQPGAYELTQHWAELVNSYSQRDGVERALFLEAYASLEDTINYYGKGKYNFMQPFNLKLLSELHQNSRPKDFKDVIMSWVDNLPSGAVANWVIGNHDNSRAANRFGEQMEDALNLLTGVLSGCKVTYYGEEIGMRDTYIRWDQTVDQSGKLLGPDNYQKASRDAERTPMQWDDSDNAGFSNASNLWLPVNPNYWYLNVAAQMEAETSHLKVYQALINARKDSILRYGDLNVIVPNNDTLVVKRTYDGEWFALIINMGSTSATYTSENLFSQNGLDHDMTVVVSSINVNLKSGLTIKKGDANIYIKPKGAVLLRSNHAEEQFKKLLLSPINLLKVFNTN